jgi:CheY-like chemotaxis protein
MGKTRVLVADDEQGILDLITAMLEPHDFQVTTATYAREALAGILKANSECSPFQLVITDIRMPGMSGIGLLHNLIAMEPNLPVIAMTAYPPGDIPSELKDFGCSLCIHKPFSTKELLDGIAKTLAAS